MPENKFSSFIFTLIHGGELALPTHIPTTRRKKSLREKKSASPKKNSACRKRREKSVWTTFGILNESAVQKMASESLALADGGGDRVLKVLWVGDGFFLGGKKSTR